MSAHGLRVGCQTVAAAVDQAQEHPSALGCEDTPGTARLLLAALSPPPEDRRIEGRQRFRMVFSKGAHPSPIDEVVNAAEGADSRVWQDKGGAQGGRTSVSILWCFSMNIDRPGVSLISIRHGPRLAGGRGDPGVARVAREGATCAWQRAGGRVSMIVRDYTQAPTPTFLHSFATGHSLQRGLRASQMRRP